LSIKYLVWLSFQTTFKNVFLGWNSVALLVLIPSCIVGLRFFRRLSLPLQAIVIYQCFSLLIEIGSRLGAIWYRQNIPLFHLYTLGEFCLLAWFYWLTTEKTAFLRQYLVWIGLVLVLLILGNTAWFGLFSFNGNAKVPAQIILILLALEFAFTFSDVDFSATVERRAVRLVNSGVLIYLVGSLYFFWFYKFIGNIPGGHNTILILMNLNASLNFIFHLLILIGLCRIIFQPRT
jgi:hypothetical protein